jgi:hypothetical protein
VAEPYVITSACIGTKDKGCVEQDFVGINRFIFADIS